MELIWTYSVLYIKLHFVSTNALFSVSLLSEVCYSVLSVVKIDVFFYKPILPNIFKKYRIRETLNLSTYADISSGPIQWKQLSNPFYVKLVHKYDNNIVQKEGSII